MNTKLLLLAIFSFFVISGNSQNRLVDWPADKMTWIQIENKTAGDKIEVIRYGEGSGMDQVLSFLKKVEFNPVEILDFDKTIILDKWIYRITFQGQQDQIILCQRYATVGKTIFAINNNVIDDFSRCLVKVRNRN